MQKECPVYGVVDFVGKRWTLLILLELYKGEHKRKRYTHIKNSLPNITPKILSARLKELEKQGMLKKQISAKTFPIKSEYYLTPRGEDFIKIIKGIKRWGLKWKISNEHCETMNCEECDF
ncbi:MAG: transcriptional regulator [Candidatus Diapherotrites archaeon]|uniref:Transcriptional regulator n=1 Tax=Candidatus Iainarchaeum sp. TaxID=3101447 RepID=A0A2D6M1Y7_9ARCH|nr:transcriptional regulator [Candidatus Diapherotrites archaeon]|tara:strand:+ start:1775 stop:2134 length:360 start_codon:yes stop_codon:yes gene_type:complete